MLVPRKKKGVRMEAPYFTGVNFSRWLLEVAGASSKVRVSWLGIWICKVEGEGALGIKLSALRITEKHLGHS